MLVIVGCLVVIGCVLGGFTIAGGSVGALIHPSEILTIGGASLGAMIVMAPKKVLIDLVKGILQTPQGLAVQAVRRSRSSSRPCTSCSGWRGATA